MMRPLLALVALACAPALADEGELFLGGAAAAEAAWLRHPLAGNAFTIDQQTAFAVVPRVMFGADYGWTNQLRVGLAFDVGVSSNVVTNAVSLGGVAGQLITGGYLALAPLATTSWRFDSGYDVTGVLKLELGPSFALWSANALADPAKLDDNGRPARLPLEIDDAWQLGGMARLSILFEARIFDSIALAVGPYAAVRWTIAPEFHAGVAIEPSFVVAPFPL